METVNLGSVIEQAITRVTRNRIGDTPPVFVTLLPALTRVPWKDSALKQFLQFFLYPGPCCGSHCGRRHWCLRLEGSNY